MHPKVFYAIELGRRNHDKRTSALLLAGADGCADLRANRPGTGFVVTVGAEHRIIMELSAPVGGLSHHYAVRQ